MCVGGGLKVGFGWGWGPCPSVRNDIVTSRHFFYFFSIYGRLLHNCSSPNAWLISIAAPAHHHETWVAMNTALFSFHDAILGPAVLKIFFRLYCLSGLVRFQETDSKEDSLIDYYVKWSAPNFDTDSHQSYHCLGLAKNIPCKISGLWNCGNLC